ncbi:MAG: hypothetical protein NTX50_21600 [Candidatus Sumerlaeota bacterium]|nr:hypothetical protein [Candidatus Sumerlaeota bacterium]
MKLNSLNRRRFIQSLAAALPASSALSIMLSDMSLHAAEEKLPPIRPITRGPKFHWRGYYDKLLFDPTNRYVLANEVDFEGRSPKADDVIRVGMIDTEDGDKWTELGSTRAWNWQQGCMLQWIPGTQSEVAWNDREGDHFICRIMDVKTGKQRKQTLLISFADAAKIPYPGGFSNGAKHWFNHLLYNTDGSRFLFLHRWRGDKEGKSWSTRMFTANPDGKELYILDPHGKTSHFVWRDEKHVMAWAWHPSRGEKFYLYRDRTDEVEVVGPDVMTKNGHNTYVPGTKDQWVLNDCYPDKDRLQHPYLYHIGANRSAPLGHLLSPKEYNGEWRCDLHPCASRDGKKVILDSTHGGNGRQVYLIDISGIIEQSHS